MRKKLESEDPFSRVDYHSAVAWPERIERERPFLLSALKSSPERSVLDLGCGTGEHCWFLASQGFEVVGLDLSETLLARAKKGTSAANPRFIRGDIRSLDRFVDRRFGAAICLGNTLANIKTALDLENTLSLVHQVLKEESLFVFQILNYARIFSDRIRYLPLNFRREDTKEIIFLRMMDLQEDGGVRFCPTTIIYDPESDSPLSVRESRSIELHGWTWEILEPMLRRAGFAVDTVRGDMTFGRYDSRRSHDLVVVARKG